ncbi:MAG: recombinase family protein [Pseudomonadales bacterium]
MLPLVRIVSSVVELLLLIVTLDSLSKRGSYVATLMEDLRFGGAEMPYADKFQLHIYAALAEQERDFISKRTKEALRAAKARGVKLGGLRDKTMKRNEALIAKADREAETILKVIKPLRDARQTLSAIAEALEEMGVKTSRGGRWAAKQVSRTLSRKH